MQHIQEFVLVQIVKRDFLNKRTNDKIDWFEATLALPSGDIVKLTSNEALYNTYKGQTMISGTGTLKFEVDKNYKFKIRLTEFSN